MELMNAEKINKISLSTQAQKQKLEEKNYIDVEIEKETYNIVIAKRAKALMRKKEIPLKIMNNENVMENKKAGFVDFGINKKDEEQTAKKETKRTLQDISNVIAELWNGGKKGDKLTVKAKLKSINTSRRKDTEFLGRIYKKLIEQGYAELRGNKGYFALVDFEDIAITTDGIIK